MKNMSETKRFIRTKEIRPILYIFFLCHVLNAMPPAFTQEEDIEPVVRKIQERLDDFEVQALLMLGAREDSIHREKGKLELYLTHNPGLGNGEKESLASLLEKDENRSRWLKPPHRLFKDEDLPHLIGTPVFDIDHNQHHQDWFAVYKEGTLKRLEKSLAKCQDPTVREIISTLHIYYTDYLNELVSSPLEKRRSLLIPSYDVFLNTLSSPQQIFSIETAYKVRGTDLYWQRLESAAASGNHSVQKLQNEIGNVIYFKNDTCRVPLQPAYERALFGLYHILFGENDALAPVTFFAAGDMSVREGKNDYSKREVMLAMLEGRMDTAHQNPNVRFETVRKSVYFQAGKGIKGQSLEQHLMNTGLDPRTFGIHVIGSLISNPTDYKPDNFIITEGSSLSQQVVGVDNDEVLNEPLFVKRKNHYMLTLKNILLIHPLMDTVVESSIRESIRSLSTEKVIMDWLIFLGEENKKWDSFVRRSKCYFNSLEKKEFPGKQQLEDEGSCNEPNIPLRLPFELILDLYKRIERLKLVLSKPDVVTYRQVFQGALPVAHRFYESVQKSIIQNPSDTFEQMFNSYIDEIISLDESISAGIFQEETKTIKEILDDNLITYGNQLLPENLLQSFKTFVQDKALNAFIRVGILPGGEKRFETQKVDISGFGNAVQSLKAYDLSSLMWYVYIGEVEKMYLQNNRIDYVPEGSFIPVPTLSNLTLSGNGMRFLFAKSFAGLHNLTKLDLRDNGQGFAGLELEEHVFQETPHLETLHLNQCKIYHLPLNLFKGLTKLKVLSLHENNITTIPDELFNDLTSLEQLKLGNNHIQTLSSRVFFTNTRLRKLSLIHNYLEGISSTAWRHFHIDNLELFPQKPISVNQAQVTLPEVFKVDPNLLDLAAL